MTQSYKAKGYRALHRAKGPAELTPEQIDRRYLRQLTKDIDEGWKHFWAKRTTKKPYRVSKHNVGMFDLPDEKACQVRDSFEG